MAFIPKAHEIYKHFKGNLYQITAIAEHSETGELLVIYQAMYGDFKIYARPLEMFVGRVDKEKYPDVAQEFRFELQGPEADRQKAESEIAIDKNDAIPCDRSEALSVKTEDISRDSLVKDEKTSMDSLIKKEESSQSSQVTEEELALDPMVLEFLDADTYEQRLNILTGLHHRITDDMITTMAVACDIEVPEGSTQERYESLKTCLLTLEKYECNRLR